MHIIIGIIIGLLICYHWPSDVERVAEKANELIHEGARKAAEATAPKSIVDEIKEKF
jgi:hypothetical protein